MNQNDKMYLLKVNIWAMIDNVITIFMAFIMRRFLIQVFGTEVSGLNGLFSNIIAALSLAMGGLANYAIHLYYDYCNKEQYEETARIERYTDLFNKSMTTIIVVIGVCTSFFLGGLIKDNTFSPQFIQIAFILQLLAECVSKFFNSKSSVLDVTKLSQYFFMEDAFTSLVGYGLQICVIKYTNNYLLYLVSVLLRIIALWTMALVTVHKRVPWVNYKIKVNFKEWLQYIANTKNTMLEQVASFIYVSTDNIVISKILGLTQVNYYTNYQMILNGLTVFINVLAGSLRNVAGTNVVSQKKDNYVSNMLKKNTKLQFFLTIFCSVSLYVLLNDFITLWLGEEFCQNRFVVFLFAINFYFVSMKLPTYNVVIMENYFKIDSVYQFGVAALNIILSVFLSVKFGIAGVLIGTIVGDMFLILLRIIYICRRQNYDSVCTLIIQNTSYLIVTMVCMLLLDRVATAFPLTGIVLFIAKMTLCVLFALCIIGYYYIERKWNRRNEEKV